ncbi:MAG: hypothetical protein WDN03_15995 [Rhizomicrobium sp.]
MRALSKVLVMLLGPGLAGCATFVEGSTQYIAISTPPVDYAACVLSRPGMSLQVTTPGAVRVEKSEDDLTLRCSRPGYRDTVATIPSDIDGWTFGNIVTGGLSVGVDAWTGAMYAYPDEFALPMAPGMAEAGAPAASTYALPPPPQPAQPAPVARKANLPGTLPDNY